MPVQVLAETMRKTLALMASTASVRMDLWQEHATAVLKAADELEAMAVQLEAAQQATLAGHNEIQSLRKQINKLQQNSIGIVTN